MLVRGVVVDDEVKIEIRRRLGVDLLEELPATAPDVRAGIQRVR